MIYILARYKRKVEVQIEMHVKYFNSIKFVYYYNILDQQKCHGLMIIDDFFFVVAEVRISDLAYIMHCPYQLSYAHEDDNW